MGQAERARAAAARTVASGSAARSARSALAIVALHDPLALAFAVPVLALWGSAPAVAAYLRAPEARRRQRSSRRSERSFDSSRGAPGGSSRRSSPRRTTGCHPTTTKRIRAASSRTGPRPPTSGSICSRSWRRATSASSRFARSRSASTRRSSTIEKLERREGHVLNWYDTETLAPLEPRYVSTVDSGNLAAYLVDASRGVRGARPRVARRSRDLRRPRRRARPRGAKREARRELDAAARRARGKARAGLGIALGRLARPRGARASLDELRRRRDDAKRRASGSSARDLSCARRTRRSPRSSRSPRSDERLARMRSAADAREDRRRRRRGRGVRAPAPDDRRARRRRSPTAMSFRFLFDEERKLFSIGYNVSAARLDASHYDLLASEARAREPRRHRQGRRRRRSTGSASARPRAAIADGPARALVVERLDVRVPDAAPRDADAPEARSSTRRTTRRCTRQMRVRRASATCRGASPSRRTTLIDLGDDLPVSRVRRARASGSRRASPRISSSRRTRQRSRRSSTRRAAAANLRALAEDGPRRPLRLLRRDRLHARRTCRRATRRRRQGVHGAPPGHDAGRARQRAQRRSDAARASTSIRASRPPSCSSKSGCRWARRSSTCARPSLRTPAPSRAGARRGRARGPAARGPLRACTCSATASSRRWSPCSASGFTTWKGLDVYRFREDAAARGRRALRVPPRRDTDDRVWSAGLPADAAPSPTSTTSRSRSITSRSPARRRHRDAHRDRGLAGAPRRGAARHGARTTAASRARSS